MIKTTLSRLKKACSSLLLAPRMLKGDLRYTPGKFQKLSISILRRTEKSTKSEKETELDYEKCKKIIELIFEPSKPADTIQRMKKTEFSDADDQHINKLPNDRLLELELPQVHEIQCEKQGSVAEASKEKDYKKDVHKNVRQIPTEYFQLNATTAKQTEKQLAQNIEIINETPMVEGEKSVIEGLNVSPKVLGNVANVQSVHLDNRKTDAIEGIIIKSTSNFETGWDDEDYKVTDTVESMVRRIEETHRLKQHIGPEEVRKLEISSSNERERSDAKFSIYNFASDRQNRKSGAPEINTPYDELAKRCLDAPSNKIDERILKEMEKLGVPSSPRRENSVIEENIIQIEVLKKPRKPVEKTEIDLETREFDPRFAYVDKLHPALKMANTPKSITDDDTYNNPLVSERKRIPTHENQNQMALYIALDCLPLENARAKYKFCSEPVSEIKSEGYPEEKASETLQFSNQNQIEANSEFVTADDKETIKLSFIIDPDTVTVDTDRYASESIQYLTRPAYKAPETNTPDIREMYDYLIPKHSALSETNTPNNLSETFHYITWPESTTLDMNNAKDGIKSLQFFPQYDPAELYTHENGNETFEFLTKREPGTNAVNNNSEQIAFFTQPEQTTTKDEIETVNNSEGNFIETPGVTYSEKSSPKSHNTETKNPISAEQISHSFVQPQTMVNGPVIDGETLENLTDEIQKAMSASCTMLSSALSLSKILKKMKKHNRMEHGQAHDRELEPETGKCGKKNPPCPPPPPKCPQCPPPCCPPQPPPCPRPCRPACPPPCPPKSPCQKFKTLFPGISLQNIITLLQPETHIQKSLTLLIVCNQITKQSRVGLTKEVSQSLQDICLDLMTDYPQKIAVTLSNNSHAENLTMARDYDPWVPIPSWPIPRKEKKRPLVCPKEGCKLIPPPKLRPPCNENPCTTFPKRSNSFSSINLFSFAMGDYIVFDIID